MTKPKILQGTDLSLYIKERQAKQVRSLKQSRRTFPKLAIVRSSTEPVIELYVRLKKNYGEDIGVEVQDFIVENNEIEPLLGRLNEDNEIHGIILQLPLKDDLDPKNLLNMVHPSKDVDALGENPTLTPATPMAIQWLINGLNIELKGKDILIIGKGRLVGQPLYTILKNAGHTVTAIDKTNGDIAPYVKNADIIVSAAGSPGLIKSDMVTAGSILIDAGTTSENGSIVGDAEDELYERKDISISSKIGGVGPLTVSALFDNVINSALSQSQDSND